MELPCGGDLLVEYGFSVYRERELQLECIASSFSKLAEVSKLYLFVIMELLLSISSVALLVILNTLLVTHET